MSELQVTLFKYIKSAMPPNLSFVDEIAEVLNISNDSAYRRIRGEKEVTFDEIQKLSERFKISVDKILNLKNGSLNFSGHFIQHDTFNFLNYLDDIYANLAYIESRSEKEIYYFSKDIPIFYYYMFPELAAFKIFVWARTLLEFPQYKNTRFSFTEIPLQFYQKVEKIAKVSCNIPAVEIMNAENILTTLRQIEYYKDIGFFASQEELAKLYLQLNEMINYMENFCAAGKKYLPGSSATSSSAHLKMYVNDFVIGDNSNIVLLDGRKMCYINHNVLHVMHTTDEKFCDYSFDFIQKIIRKSNLISEVGERERTIFFNLIRQRIRMYENNEVRTINKS